MLPPRVARALMNGTKVEADQLGGCAGVEGGGGVCLSICWCVCMFLRHISEHVTSKNVLDFPIGLKQINTFEQI